MPVVSRVAARLAGAAALVACLGVGAQTWTFAPTPDRFSANAALDLRSLNEAVAGEHGFVRSDGRGGFVRGDGQPIRFWAVNSEVGRRPFVATPLGPREAPDLARHARFLAKRGVNLVRLHRQLGSGTAERDAIWRAVAAYRREGIYVALSPYWAATADPAAPPWGELFFDPDRQRAYRAALRELLLTPNPHTGVPLAREPALAMLQLQNEDSLLFWTVDRIAGAARERLEARYVEFLARNGRDASSAPLLPMWELTRPASGRKARRLADQTEFLARTMRQFNDETVRWLRDEIGLRALVNAGNWRTASAAHLGDAERWSYLAGEVDAVNVYTAGVHRGEHAGWAIARGDVYRSLSVLDTPQALPLQVKQSVDRSGLRPMWVSEGHWTPPNAYAAEGPWMTSVLGASAGLASYAWFTTEDEGFSAPRSANGYLPSLAKWNFATPEVLGSFPAAALVFRRGLVPRAPPFSVEARSSEDLWQRRVPRLVESPGFDPNRDADPSPPHASVGGGPWPGPAWTVFDGAASPTASAAPRESPWRFDPKGRSLTLDAAAAQGVVAFFEMSPEHHTRDLEIRCGNPHGALLAVALDDEPLRRSRRVLIQFATTSRPTGWRETARPDGLRHIDDIGRAPWQVDSARLSLRLHNPALRRARVLDMNLEARGEVALSRDGSSLALRFPPDAMYLLLD